MASAAHLGQDGRLFNGGLQEKTVFRVTHRPAYADDDALVQCGRDTHGAAQLVSHQGLIFVDAIDARFTRDLDLKASLLPRARALRGAPRSGIMQSRHLHSEMFSNWR